MKARIITSLMALAALLAVSCSKETGRQQEETSLPQAAISVQASVSELTKAATAGAETSFEAGDQLSLYVWTGSAAAVSSKKVVDGVVNTFDGTIWTPASRMLWKNVRDPHFFLGIFPAREVSSFTEDPVTSGEDLLVATVLGDGIVAPQTTTAPPVDLVFDHMMARLNVNVKYRNQWGGVPEDAVVVAKAATQGTIDYLTKTITPGTVTTQALTATAAATGYDATYSALCIPQDGVRAFEFHIDGQTFVYTHGEDLPLQAGKVTSISLLVGKDKIAVDDGTVANWDEGEVDPDMEDASGVLANVTRPLTFKALENGTSVTFTDRRSSGKVTWITSDGRTGTISLINNTVSLAAGQRVWFLGDGTNSAFGTGAESTSSRIALNKDAEVYGNIMSLLGPDFATATTLTGNNTFAYLFSGQTHLKNSAEKGLILPAATLTAGCYKGLFKGCTGLKQVVINAADISAAGCLAEWLDGTTAASLSIVSVNSKMWTMGDNLPWGATILEGEEKMFTAPMPITTALVYNTAAQTLIQPGTAHKDGVVLEYSTDGTAWNAAVPTGTDAGNYNVYCRMNDGGVSSAALSAFIAPKVVSSPAITLSQSSYTYDGSAKTPAVSSVKDGTVTIPASEYTVSYKDNTNAGTATVTITDKSGGNYTVSGSATFTIAPKVVTNPAITLSQTSYSYDGNAKTPSVSSVKDGTVTIPASEYTVSYKNNTNAGTATVTITDKSGGNYTVSGSKTFTINKVSCIIVTAPTAKSLAFNGNRNNYNGSPQALVNAGTAKGGTMMYKLGNGSWSSSIPTATNAGTYTVYYKAAGSNSNYTESAEGSVQVTITKADGFIESTLTTYNTNVFGGNTGTVYASGELSGYVMTNAMGKNMNLTSNNTTPPSYSVSVSTTGPFSYVMLVFSCKESTNYKAVDKKSISLTLVQ